MISYIQVIGSLFVGCAGPLHAHDDILVSYQHSPNEQPQVHGTYRPRDSRIQASPRFHDPLQLLARSLIKEINRTHPALLRTNPVRQYLEV